MLLLVRLFFYSQKPAILVDFVPFSAIDLGVDRITVNWKNDLPEFPSNFGEHYHPYAEPRNYLIDICPGIDPPSKVDVLKWCQSRNLEVKPQLMEEEEEESCDAANKTHLRVRRDSGDSIGSEISISPPSSVDGNDVVNATESGNLKRFSIEISGRTLNSSEHGGGSREDTLRGVNEVDEYYHLTLFAVEIFVSTRQELLPDPEFDTVTCLVYSVGHEGPAKNYVGLIAIDPTIPEDQQRNFLSERVCNFPGDRTIVQTENELFVALIDAVREVDPDVLVGYETQRSSWGFLCRRATILNINLAAQLSRMPTAATDSRFTGPNG